MNDRQRERCGASKKRDWIYNSGKPAHNYILHRAEIHLRRYTEIVPLQIINADPRHHPGNSLAIDIFRYDFLSPLFAEMRNTADQGFSRSIIGAPLNKPAVYFNDINIKINHIGEVRIA